MLKSFTCTIRMKNNDLIIMIMMMMMIVIIITFVTRTFTIS